MQAEVLEAKLGALNPGRSEENYDPEEHQLGMLIRVHGRFVESAERGIYRDAEMLYWLDWDQSEERWAIRLTRRQGRASQSEAHSGVRTARTLGNPRGTITVVTTSVDGSNPKPTTYKTPAVYLSQALRWMLGRLLAGEAAQSFDWYFYDSVESALVLRSDQWAPAGDGSQNWMLRTTPRPGAAATVSIYSPTGEFVRRTSPDGSISEPITLAELHRIWRSKGLETGKIR